MTQELIIREMTRPGVSTLTLNRPDKRNALSKELLEGLCRFIEKIEREPDARILVLRGAGPVFCSGLDLSQARDPELADESAHLLAATLSRIWESPLVSVAAVHGAAIAGGAGVAAACDFVLCAEGTVWSFPEVRRGLVPAFIGAVLLRQAGRRDVLEWLLGAERVDSSRLERAGIINRVVPADRLNEAVGQLTASILAGAPEAERRTKKLLDQLSGVSLREQLEVALADHMQGRSSTEAREGILAFLEKRPPRWTLG